MRVINPENVIESLKKHILVDGFHVVADLEKSHDSWIVDKNNQKKYLDLYSQFASQALGWNHPALVSNLHRFLPVLNTKIANSDMYTSQYAEFVDTFSSITPDFRHYFFIDGGALAVENALKCAFDWKSRLLGLDHNKCGNFLKVIHLKNAFHGRSGYTMSLTNTGNIKTGLFPQFNWPRVEPNEKGLEEIEQILKKEDAVIAAIIVEPIQGEGGDVHLSTEFLKKLRTLSNQFDVMLIFDEVQTGLGLTGKWWAYQHHNVIPDILVFGKKTQVGGIAVTSKVDLVKDNVFQLSGRLNSTWGANIVDMVRATIIIETIRDNDYIKNAALMGEYFTKELAKINEILNLRSKGLMIAFDLPTDKRRDEVFENLHKHNVLSLKCGQKGIRFRPLLTINKKEIDFAILNLKQALCK